MAPTVAASMRVPFWAVGLAAVAVHANESPHYLVARHFDAPADVARHRAGAAMTGHVDIVTEGHDNQAMQVLRFRVTGVDPACVAPPNARAAVAARPPRACALYIAAGNPCAPQAPEAQHLWNRSEVAASPWQSLSYHVNDVEPGENSTRLSVAHGTIRAITGLDHDVPAGHSVVLHDASGALLGCSRIERVHGCYPEDEWRTQGFFDFSHAHERCGFATWCTKGHPECMTYCNDDDNQCPEDLVCDVVTETCRHKDLFGGRPGIDALAGVMFAAISGLAMSVGVGGGGFFVPLLMLLLRFEVHEATALSQACLAGGAITAMVYNARDRHPHLPRPMIDYDLLVITCPSLLLGSLVGTFLNKVTPDVIILLLLDVVLTYCLYATLNKALAAWRKEDVTIAAAAAAREASPEAPISSGASKLAEEAGVPSASAPGAVELGALPAGGGMSGVGPAEPSPKPVTFEHVMNGATSNAQERAQYPLDDIALFACTWLLVVASSFVRGSAKIPGLVPEGSTTYWTLTVITGAMLACLAVWGCELVSKRAAIEVLKGGKINADAAHHDVTTLTIWALGGGVVAALCGVGGGMVMGPIMLKLGVLPQVQSATTGAMMLIMSTSTAIGYLAQGAAPLDYALFLAFATGCGALFGKAIVSAVIKRFQRPSLVMFLLAFLIFLSMGLMTFAGVLKVLPDILRLFGDEDLLATASFLAVASPHAGPALPSAAFA